MRLIVIGNYKWQPNGKSNPEARARELLESPTVAILKRLAVEHLGVEAESFDALAMEEVSKPDSQDEVDYLVRDSIVEILFHPNLQLGGKQLLDQNILALKIEKWPDNDLLLEEDEYNKVKAGVEALRGLGRHDVEFISRILNAPTVEVQAKPAVEAVSATPTK